MKVLHRMCMTKDVGVNNNLFGGNMLAWMDEAAAIYAHLVTGEKRMVTKKFSKIVFHVPVKERDIVEIHCNDAKIGTTSITFKIAVLKGLIAVTDATCTFVAVDEYGKCKVIDQSKVNASLF